MADKLLYMITMIFTLSMFLILSEWRYSRRVTLSIAAGLLVVCGGAFFFALDRVSTPALAAFLCLSLPSLPVQALLAKYRGWRYIVTFCAADIWSMMTLAVSGILGHFAFQEDTPGAESLLITSVLFILLLAGGLRIRRPYQEMQRQLLKGWGSLALLALAFYVQFLMTTGYPAPLKTRMEYAPAVLMTVAVIILAYVFMFRFIYSMQKNKTLADSRELLRVQLELKEHQIKEQDLYYQLAYKDSMTDLFNRTAYNREIEDILSGRITGGWPLCCLMFDLNNLKYTNDTYGHLAGDNLLHDTAEILKKSAGEAGRVFRMGGDEFLMFLPGMDEAQADIVVRSIDEELADYNASHAIALALACGCSCLAGLPEEGSARAAALNDLVHEADTRMYEDKREKKQAGRTGCARDTAKEGQDDAGH